jgi:hypothetical protein
MARKKLLTLLDALSAAAGVISTARRNRKPLNGDNHYSRKFVELQAEAMHLWSQTKASLQEAGWAGNEHAIVRTDGALEEFFFPTEFPEVRRNAKRDIFFLFKSEIEPALRGRPTHQPTDTLLPLSIVEGTRGYIDQIARQAAGCYDQQWYDACSVMVRRLVETLIIECYEHYHVEQKVKDNKGDFVRLEELVGRFLNEPSWNVSRNVKRGLHQIKTMGDLSAHNRRYVAKKGDIDNWRTELRVAVEELVSIAGFK